MKHLNKRGKITVSLTAIFGIFFVLGGLGNLELYNTLSSLFFPVIGLILISFSGYLYNITHEE